MSVYFIQYGEGGPIKIGHSRDPYMRLVQLRQSHVSLALLSYTDGGRREEAELHARFAPHRLRGEFFYPHSELMAFISALPKAPRTRREAKQIFLRRLLAMTPSGTPITIACPKDVADRYGDFLRAVISADENGTQITMHGTALTADAARALIQARAVYAGEERIPTSEEAQARGRKGGRAAARTLRAPLTAEHKRMWHDKHTYATNPEAAAAIGKALSRPVSVPTLRRRFGSSGRPSGWPNRESKD